MDAVAAVAGATGQEMTQLSDLALRLGKDTAFSASEAAAGLEELVKGGVEIPEIMSGAADATLNLAAAGGTTLAKAAEIAANSMNQFSLEGKDMEEISNLIAGAANATTISVEDFGMSISQAGAAVASAGGSFQDAALGIAALGEMGIKGSDAGTSLKTMYLNLVPATDKAAEKMRELGLITEEGANRFFDAEGKVKSYEDIATILGETLGHLSEEQQISNLRALFGTDAYRAAFAAVKLYDAGVGSLNEKLRNTTAAEVAKTRMDNLAGSWEQFTGGLETAGIMIGQMTTGPLRGLVDWADGMVNRFIEFIPTIQRWSDGLAGVFGFLRGEGTQSLSAFGSILSETFGPQIATQIQAAMITIRDQVRGIFKSLVDIFTDGGQGGELQLATILNNLFGKGVEEAVIGIVQRVKGAFDQIKLVIADFQAGGLAAGGTSILTNLLGMDQATAEGIVATVQGIITRIGEVLTAFSEGGASAAFDNIFGPGAAEALGRFAETVNTYILPALSEFGALLKDHVLPNVLPFLGFLRDTRDAGVSVTEFFNGLAGAIEWVGNSLSAFGEAWRSAVLAQLNNIAFLQGAYAAALPAIGQFFSDLGTKASELASTVGQKFSELGTAAGTLATDVGQKFSELGTAAQSLLREAGNAFSELGTAADGLRREVATAFDNIGTKATEMLTNVTSALGEIISEAQRVAGSVFDTAFNIGFNLIEGIKSGISNTLGSLRSMVQGWADQLPQWMKDRLGITSPSKVFAEIGMQMSAGLIRGLSQSEGDAKNAMVSFLDTALFSHIDEALFQEIPNEFRGAARALANLIQSDRGIGDWAYQLAVQANNAGQAWGDALAESMQAGVRNAVTSLPTYGELLRDYLDQGDPVRLRALLEQRHGVPFLDPLPPREQIERDQRRALDADAARSGRAIVVNVGIDNFQRFTDARVDMQQGRSTDRVSTLARGVGRV